MEFKGFIGGAYKGRSVYQNAQTCVNLFPISDPTGKNITALVGTPGLKIYAEYSISAPVRALMHVDSVVYAVIGDTFVEVAADGTITDRGTVETSTGIVEWAYNGTQIMLVDGTYGYIYTISTSTLTKITDADFPVPSSLTYQDGYFIVSKADSDEFFVSALYDGTTWDALDFASAESHPDAAVAIFSDHREVWIFGEKTIEVFYNSGNAAFPFERISGSIQEIGCGAAHSIAQGDNTLFWFDNRGFVVRATGYNHKIVSTRNIEYQWSQYAQTDDAYAICYTFQGHVWYQITFPSADATWVYDVATNEWHERRSYKASGGNGRHRIFSYCWTGTKHLAGDFENGKIYEIDMDTYTENNEHILRERTAPVIANENLLITYNRFELDIEPGVGDLVNDPAAMLSWSNDGGRTWSNEIWRTFGKVGEYFRRCVWHQLGMARNRVFRLRITDAYKVVIVGAYLKLRVNRH